MALVVLLGALLAANVAIGSVTVPVRSLIPVLFSRAGDISAGDISTGDISSGGISGSGQGAADPAFSMYRDIIWQIRLPRALAAAILGGALALSGYLLQTFFHNPIAGPFILGISSGARLAVALMMVLFAGVSLRISSATMILAAFAGAMLSMGVVLLMARVVDRMAMLIVGGVMIGYICSAVTDFLVTFADDADIVNLHDWSRGSFSGISWGNVSVMSVVVFAAVICIFLLAKPMNAYQLGEAYAQNMGVNVHRFRVLLVLLSSVLSACVTAFAGPVSFVGIAVPHLMKQLFRTARPIVLIPACFLGGAVFCLFCDLLARTLFAPTELGISTVTAVFGAPVVIAILLHKNSGKRG
jgi:iron complex transport system permease protein